MSVNTEEFEAAVEHAFRLDLLAKEAKEAADAARAEVKALVIGLHGNKYDGGTSKFHVSLNPTSTYNAALVEAKLDPKELKKVLTPTVDRKKVEALFAARFAAGEFSKPNSPTLKITLED